MLSLTFSNDYLKKIDEKDHILWNFDFLRVLFFGVKHPDVDKTYMQVVADYLPPNANNLHLLEIKQDKDSNNVTLVVEAWLIKEDNSAEILTDPYDLHVSMIMTARDITDFIRNNPNETITRKFSGTEEIKLHAMHYSALEEGLISLEIEPKKNAPVRQIPAYMSLLDPSEYQFWNAEFIVKILQVAWQKLLESGEHNFPTGTSKLLLSKIFQDPRRQHQKRSSVDYVLEVRPWITEIAEDGDETVTLSDKHYGILIKVANKKLFNKEPLVCATTMNPNVTLIGMTDFTSAKLEQYKKKSQTNKVEETDVKSLAESMSKSVLSEPQLAPEPETHVHIPMEAKQNLKEEEEEINQPTKIAVKMN